MTRLDDSMAKGDDCVYIWGTFFLACVVFSKISANIGTLMQDVPTQLEGFPPNPFVVIANSNIPFLGGGRKCPKVEWESNRGLQGEKKEERDG